MQKLLLLFLVIAFHSCQVAKVRNEDQAVVSLANPETIQFLILKMNKNPGGKSGIVLVSKTTASGKLKKGNEPPADPENYLTVEVSQNNVPMQTMLISHPLYKTVEYVDDNNKFQAKRVEDEEAEFFFRLQVNGAATVRISETLKNKSKTELITLKI